MNGTTLTATATPAQTRHVVLGALRAVPGYLPGMRQPALLVECHVAQPPAPEQLQSFKAAIEGIAGSLPALSSTQLAQFPTLAILTQALLGLMNAAGWPTMSEPQLLRQAAGSHGAWIAFPGMHGAVDALAAALQELVELLNAGPASEDKLRSDRLHNCLRRLRQQAPGGINTLRFLQAAHAQEVPWKRVSGNVFQFGWGARARWLDSSFTEQTSRISTMLCRDKRRAASILRRAGMPVPAHGNARNEAEALRIAARLGYPVVVKPADLDGGRGVKTHLTTPADVARAFAAARALSKQVLVEKHIDGNDYRLQVFRGEVYWATHRVPASITGDGEHTVRELVNLVNAEPRRAAIGGLKRIMLDDESNAWLARQQLTLDAVPGKDRFVRLKGAANVASGGTIVPVLEDAHPDNLALAARAARLLRLDVAGVDLLIPDIRRSWLETGGAICEVNAQPQMAKQLPALLLPRLVPARGRIPVVMIVGSEATAAGCKEVHDALLAAWPGMGFAAHDGAWIAGQQLAKGPLAAFHAAQCILDDPAATLALLQVNDASMLRAGCCVDAIDHLVIAGPLAAPATWAHSLQLANSLARMSKRTWLLDTASEWRQLAALPAPVDVPSAVHGIVGTLAGEFA